MQQRDNNQGIGLSDSLAALAFASDEAVIEYCAKVGASLDSVFSVILLVRLISGPSGTAKFPTSQEISSQV